MTSEITIPKHDLDILNNHINEVLNQINTLECSIRNQSDINSIISENTSVNGIYCSIIEYSIIDDDDEFITISAFCENELQEQEISSKDSSIFSKNLSFSPVEPIDMDYSDPGNNNHCITPKITQVCDEISSNSELNCSLETISSTDTICHPMNIACEPFVLLEDAPFSKFSVSDLEFTTEFTHQLESRSIAYYGDTSYSYGNIHHSPRLFSDNAYLCKILSYLTIVLPDAQFNSALVHRYVDGNQFIKHHSDNEAEIVEGSTIITISLGSTRCMEFKKKCDGTLTTVNPSHGDVLLMTKNSQKFFSHSITPEEDTGIRLSITLRQISTIPNNVEVRASPCNTELTNFLHEIGGSDYSSYGQNFDSDSISEDVHYHRASVAQGYQNEPPINDEVRNSIAGYQPPPIPCNMLRQQEFQLADGYQSSQPFATSYAATAAKPRSRPPLPTSTMPTHHKLKLRQTNNWKPPSHVQPNLVFPAEQMHPSRHNDSVPKRFVQKSDTIYISSSMFADFDPIKLSSQSQNAHVFHFNGANAGRMLNKALGSERLNELSKKTLCIICSCLQEQTMWMKYAQLDL